MQAKAKTIQLVYGMVYGLMSVAVAFLVILQVCDIYFNGGTSPYTVETIRQHFNEIAVFVYIWLLTAVVGYVLWQVFPTVPPKLKRDVFYTFHCLKKQLDIKHIEKNEEMQGFDKSLWAVNFVKLICGVCIGICAVFGIAYLCEPSNFTNQDQNAEVLRAALYLLPFVLVSFALCVGVSFLEKAVIVKHMPKVKQMILQANEQEKTDLTRWHRLQTKVSAFFESKHTLAGIRLIVAVLGIVLTVYGLATDGNAGVLAKAVTICRQCIGLG